jgi:hypothetical protein
LKSFMPSHKRYRKGKNVPRRKHMIKPVSD